MAVDFLDEWSAGGEPPLHRTPSLLQCFVHSSSTTSQYISVEGNSWSGAWTWISAGNSALAALTDNQNKIIYEMHQYLDSDGSGTSVDRVSNTIGAERLAAATACIKANNKKGIIGEFAGGANTQCKRACSRTLGKTSMSGLVPYGGQINFLYPLRILSLSDCLPAGCPGVTQRHPA